MDMNELKRMTQVELIKLIDTGQLIHIDDITQNNSTILSYLQVAAHKKYEEKAKQEYEYNIIRVRNSNARIAAVAAEARKAGLSYGKYVASLREDANNGHE